MSTPNKGAALFSDCEGFLNELSTADEAVLTGGTSRSSSSSSSSSSRSSSFFGGFRFGFGFSPFFFRRRRYFC